MGISIDLHIYDAAKLQTKLKKWGAKDDQLSRKILEACGTFAGDRYFLLDNEYSDGCSPYYNIATLFNAAFKKDDSFKIFLDSNNKQYGINCVDEQEVAEDLGINLEEDE